MRRFTALLVSLVLVLAAVGSADAQKGKQRSTKTKKVSQLKRDLSRVQSKKSRVRSELRATKHEKQVVRGDIAVIDNRLTTITSSLEDTTDQLEVSRAEQKQLGSQLVEATAQLADTKQKVRNRLRWMYVHGNGTFLSVLIGSKSLGEVASRDSLMRRIAKKDQQLFSRYQSLRASVADKKARTDELVGRIAGLAERQRTQQQDLKEARAEKKSYYSQLSAKQQDLEEALAQFEADQRQIESQISAYSRSSSALGRPLPAFSGRFSMPASGPITSGFGSRYHPILHKTRMHTGVDIGAGYGASVHAAAAGRVIAAQYMRGYGNTVIIDHGGNVSTVYGHMSRILVSTGQSVSRGQVIGKVGATGLATGPHLHWEVRINGKAVNPLSHR